MDVDNQYVKKLREIAEATSVWRPASAQDEPITKLYHWSVYQVELPSAESHTIHFVGWTGIEGRVSSPIQSYDSIKKEGISRSGRIYKLVGPNGHHSDAMYVWSRWKRIFNVVSPIDATEEYEANPVS